MTKEEKKEANKKYYEANKDKRKEYLEANKDRIKGYYKANKDRIKEYYEANKDSIKEKKKEYYEANKDIIKDKRKEYQEANKDRINHRKKEWFKNYYNNNHIFRLTKRIRTLIRKSLNHSYKKNSRTAEILGCSFEEFKAHIEEQFPRDMTWDNSSLWHYDHIIPVASATSEEELLRLNHYTNFQPLWEEDNREKYTRLDWVKCPIKYAK
jgi:hypothetical protein